jgi:hypothetical protein
MKQKIKLIYYFAILSVVLSSCLKDECTQTQTFTQYNPIYKSLTQIRSEFNVQGQFRKMEKYTSTKIIYLSMSQN